jgi:hypothetical protein
MIKDRGIHDPNGIDHDIYGSMSAYVSAIFRLAAVLLSSSHGVLSPNSWEATGLHPGSSATQLVDVPEFWSGHLNVLDPFKWRNRTSPPPPSSYWVERSHQDTLLTLITPMCPSLIHSNHLPFSCTSIYCIKSSLSSLACATGRAVNCSIVAPPFECCVQPTSPIGEVL